MAGLAACESADEPGPRAIDGVFPPTAELPQLPFRVADLTGSVRAVSIGNADAPLEGVQPVPGRDDALSVIWIGGVCDRHVLVTLEGQRMPWRSTSPRSMTSAVAGWPVSSATS